MRKRIYLKWENKLLRKWIKIKKLSMNKRPKEDWGEETWILFTKFWLRKIKILRVFHLRQTFRFNAETYFRTFRRVSFYFTSYNFAEYLLLCAIEKIREKLREKITWKLHLMNSFIYLLYDIARGKLRLIHSSYFHLPCHE